MAAISIRLIACMVTDAGTLSFRPTASATTTAPITIAKPPMTQAITITAPPMP